MEKQTKNLLKKAFKFIGFVLVSELTGIAGSFFTMPAIGGWYASLAKPSFNPPNWLFAPVWTILFFFMGTAAFLVSESKTSQTDFKKSSINLFFLHLFFNFLWNVLFFGLNMLLVSVVEILLLLAIIVLLTVRFYKINKVAGYLMIPYVLWVSFASILTSYIFLLNM